MNPNPHLLISRAKARTLLQNQIERGKAIRAESIDPEFEDWKTRTRELLSSMFDSSEFADEFSQATSFHHQCGGCLNDGIVILERISQQLGEHGVFEKEKPTPVKALPPAMALPVVPFFGPFGLLGFALVAMAFLFSSPGQLIGWLPTQTPNPSPGPSPTVTPPTRLEDIVASEVQRLAEGRIVFNPPTTMQQGKQERIEARITSQDIGARLTEGLRGRGAPEVEKIRIAPVMKVALLADEGDFKITRLSSEEQIVTGQPYAQWEWTVKPEQYGERSLHLKATAKVVIESLGERAVDVPVIDKTINVSISPGYIAKRTISNPSAWQLVLGGGGLLTIMSTIFLGIRRYIKNRKKRPVGF